MRAARLVAHTLRLGNGLEPTQLAAQWRDARTGGLDRLVEFEGCALWLQRRLQQIGAASLAELGFASWLRRRAHADAARNLLVDAEMTVVAKLLARWGVPHLFIKGSARRLACQLYPFADARATHDVDVLVPADAAQPVWDRLRAWGYGPAMRPDETPPEHHHLPALWNDGRVAVEVHCSTSPYLAPAAAWTRATAGASDVERDGLRLRVPGATELLWNGLAHGLRHRANGFRLHFLLDGAAIWASGATIDWREIVRRAQAGEAGRRAGRWLSAAAWLAGVDPSAVAAELRPFDVPGAVSRRGALLRYFRANGRLGELLCWWTVAPAGVRR